MPETFAEVEERVTQAIAALIPGKMLAGTRLHESFAFQYKDFDHDSTGIHRQVRFGVCMEEGLRPIRRKLCMTISSS